MEGKKNPIKSQKSTLKCTDGVVKYGRTKKSKGNELVRIHTSSYIYITKKSRENDIHRPDFIDDIVAEYINHHEKPENLQ